MVWPSAVDRSDLIETFLPPVTSETSQVTLSMVKPRSCMSLPEAAGVGLIQDELAVVVQGTHLVRRGQLR